MAAGLSRRTMAAVGIGVAGLVAAAGAIAVGQSQATPVVVVTEPVLRPAVLQAGDLVGLTMYSLMEAGRPEHFELHVSDEGISVPVIGVIPVRGMTTDKAAAAISAEMARQNVLRDAVVLVGLERSGPETRVRPGGIDAGQGLRVTVYELTGQGSRTEILAMVADDGTIDLPGAGTIKVQGLTEVEADALVRRTYRDKNVLMSPIVSVLRLDGAGRP